MLGKVIVHGPDRESARRALVDALDDTAILGFTTNVGFLRVLAASDEFRDATIDTAWLDTADRRRRAPAPDDDLARIVAAWTQAMLVATNFKNGTPPPVPVRRVPARRGAGATTCVELDRVVRVDRRARRRSTASRSPSCRPSGTSCASASTATGTRPS